VCGNCVYKHFDKAYTNKKCRKYSMNALFVTLAPVQGPILLNSFSAEGFSAASVNSCILLLVLRSSSSE